MNNKLLLCVILAASLLGGCGGGSTSDAESDGESPERVARENARTALQALADSDKGIDDSGDRLWKQEAREYFNYRKHPDNRTFELNADWAREFTEAAYSAGAEEVWVVEISEFELAGDKYNMSDNMVVVLPLDRQKRDAIFRAYNLPLQEAGFESLADVGQSHIFITGD